MQGVYCVFGISNKYSDIQNHKISDYDIFTYKQLHDMSNHTKNHMVNLHAIFFRMSKNIEWHNNYLFQFRWNKKFRWFHKMIIDSCQMACLKSSLMLNYKYLNPFRSGDTHGVSWKTISFSGWHAWRYMTQNTFYVKNKPAITEFFLMRAK